MSTVRNHWPEIALILLSIFMAIPGVRELCEFVQRPDLVYDILPVEGLDWVMEEVEATTTSWFITGVEISNARWVAAKSVNVHIKDLRVAVGAPKPYTDRLIIDCGEKRDPKHGGPGHDFLKCSQPDLLRGTPTLIRLAFNGRVTLGQDNIKITFVTPRNLAGSARFAGDAPSWRSWISRFALIALPSFWIGWGAHWIRCRRRAKTQSSGQGRKGE